MFASFDQCGKWETQRGHIYILVLEMWMAPVLLWEMKAADELLGLGSVERGIPNL